MQSVVSLALTRQNFTGRIEKILKHRHSEGMPDIIPVFLRDEPALKIRQYYDREFRAPNLGSMARIVSIDAATERTFNCGSVAMSVAIEIGAIEAKWGEKTAIGGQFGIGYGKGIPRNHRRRSDPTGPKQREHKAHVFSVWNQPFFSILSETGCAEDWRQNQGGIVRAHAQVKQQIYLRLENRPPPPAREEGRIGTEQQPVGSEKIDRPA